MKTALKFTGLLIFMMLTSGVQGQYIARDWEERDRWMDVERIFELAGIAPGSRVADLGCHEGYLTVRLAKKVGPEGKVYAVDINEKRLKTLKEHAKAQNLDNVETVPGETDDPKLPAGALDVVVIMDTYHEMTEYKAILAHVKNAITPGGRIVVIEKMKSHVRDASRKRQTEAHTLAMRYVKEELEEAGFSIVKAVEDFGNWENDASKQIWLLVASPDTPSR